MLNQLESNEVVRVLSIRVGHIDNTLTVIDIEKKPELYSHLIEEKYSLQNIVKKLNNSQALKDRSYYQTICENEGYVSAIKAYRKDSGLPLKDSKETIDRWMKEFGWKHRNGSSIG